MDRWERQQRGEVCEHGLRRPCEECDPYMFSRWLTEKLGTDKVSSEEAEQSLPIVPLED